MTSAERKQIKLLALRAYELELSLGRVFHYVGNELGGETDEMEMCCVRVRELRETLERVGDAE